MRMVYSLIAGSYVAVSLGCASTQTTTRQAAPPPAASITAPEAEIASHQTAWSKIRSGALIVDVRSPEEYANGHLDRAVNVPYQQIAEKLPQIETNKTREIVLYCGSGRRARIAQAELQKLGYEGITNAGAFSDLIKEKL